MKIQLLDHNEEVAHEFEVADSALSYDNVVLWEPTGKHYGYHDQAGDYLQFIEKVVISINPEIGG